MSAQVRHGKRTSKQSKINKDNSLACEKYWLKKLFLQNFLSPKSKWRKTFSPKFQCLIRGEKLKKRTNNWSPTGC